MKSIEHKLVFSGGAGQQLPLVNPMSSIQFSMLNCIQPCSNVNFNKTFLACFVYTPLLIKKKKRKFTQRSVSEALTTIQVSPFPSQLQLPSSTNPCSRSMQTSWSVYYSIIPTGQKCNMLWMASGMDLTWA